MATAYDIMLKIRVTNLETKAVYIHNKVPLEHVEMLRMNQNLKIEVLGRTKGRFDENFRKRNKNT